MANPLRSMYVGIAVIGAAAVMLGAFGSHGLKDLVDDRMIESWKTGVQYQFYHLVLLVLAAQQYDCQGSKLAVWAFRLAVAGILLFSGSLYLLAVRVPLGIEGWTWLGPITPMGGLCFVAAWVLLGAGYFRADLAQSTQTSYP